MISRNPDEYDYSIHASQQYRWRDIERQHVDETIETGKVTEAACDHQREFIKEYVVYDYPVGVIVDIEDKEIITVEYIKE